MNWIPDYNYILGSKSPRRSQLLSSVGIKFQVESREVEEVYPDGLPKEEIPIYLAKLKAKPFQNDLSENDLLITADTIVWIENKALGKPRDKTEAVEMLQSLSGNDHLVISGVCLSSKGKQKSFSCTTKVHFKNLSSEEINYYIDTYQPYDKAGAYGIQEWIGSIAISRIDGSFYNVMGLPIQRLYEEIQMF